MYERIEKQVFDWSISCKGNEIFVLSDENMGRAIAMDGMKVAAKVTLVDNLVKVNTIEGYAAQINFGEKHIIIINERITE